MEKDANILTEFNFAMSELKKKGDAKISFYESLHGSVFKVSISINSLDYREENIDLIIAIIQLNNQL